MLKKSDQLKCLFGIHQWTYKTTGTAGAGLLRTRKCGFCNSSQINVMSLFYNKETVGGTWKDD